MYDPSGFPIALHCIYVVINMVKSVFLLETDYYNAKIFLTRVCVIDIDNHNYNAVLTRICARHAGS